MARSAPLASTSVTSAAFNYGGTGVSFHSPKPPKLRLLSRPRLPPAPVRFAQLNDHGSSAWILANGELVEAKVASQRGETPRACEGIRH